jgi:spermidine/putrescine transport system ATP-binding protein
LNDTIAVATRDIVKTFGQGDTAVHALDHVSVDVAAGEFFTLLGPSGCGKTTLLRMIAGFESPTAGRILLDGADITALPPNKRAVNTVFQSYALFPHLTVAENIGFGLTMQGRPKGEVQATVARMLALVKLDSMATRKSSQLSGGQQQRVALARALAPAPRVLLLDESLSALDQKLRKDMQGELKRLQRETGITFVFVTHDQEEALTMSDRIAVMNAGCILQIGTPQDIYMRPANRFVASFIGETNFLPATATAQGVTLGNGTTIPVTHTASGNITLAIRPEHVRLGNDGIPATITNLVYFGTDTHAHATLSDGAQVVARVPSDATPLTMGQTVHLSFAPGAAQVLGD